MDIVKENKIKQVIKADLTSDDKEMGVLKEMMKEFCEKTLKQKIEGNIEGIDISSYSYGCMSISISTLKEDKLKLIEDKTIDVR